MKKIRKIFSRVTAAIAAFAIAATTIVSSFPSVTAEAATGNQTIRFIWGAAYNPIFPSAKYANSKGISGQYIRAREQVTRLYLNDDNKNFVFCVQPSAHLGSFDDGTGETLRETGYTKYNLDKETASDNYWNTNFGGFSNLDWRKYFGLVQYYGYASHKNLSTPQAIGAYYVATQLLIWEMVLGYRGHTKADFATCTDSLLDDVTYPTYGIATKATATAAYNEIVNAVKVHYTYPSTNMYETEALAKASPTRFKYNNTAKRYEAKFSIPTNVVQSTSLRNWSGYKTAIENAIKGKLNGTYGTDYGVTNGYTSGSNTIYTVWSNKNPMLNSSTVITGSVAMTTSSDVNVDNSLYVKSGKQTVIYSPSIDPATAYFALGTTNEPNIVVDKTYKDASGVTVTGTDLTGLLADTEYIVYTVEDGTTKYIIANDNGTSYTFSEFTTNKNSATKFKYKSSTNTTGTFNLYDCPTNTSSAKTYTVEEVKTPSDRYEPLKTNVTLPVPTSSNQTNRVSFINEMSGSDYGTAALHKEISDAEIDPTTAEGIAKQAEIYKNTKFVVAYWGTNSGTPVLRFFTNAYKTAAPALSGDLSNLVDFTAVTYSEGDGCYYLPTRFNSDELVYDWTRTSEDIADAYVFDLGSNYSGTTTCDRFGQLYFNMLPLAGTEAKELLFIEIDSDDEYGYLKGTTEYTFDEVTKMSAANRRSLSGVMQLPATTIGGISCPAGAYPIVGLNGSATAHSSTAELVNYPITYPLAFRKVNTETGEYVTGAAYGLYDANKQLIKQTSETDSNGYYKFTELKPNRTYFVREIEAPAGFTLNETYYEVKNSYTPIGGVSVNELDLKNDLEVSETPYYLTIEVKKYDEQTGFGIKDITFDIYRNDETAPIGSMTTDENGNASYEGLYLGKLVNDVFENKFKVVEKENDDYFMVDADGNIIDSFTVSVTSADITSSTNPVIKYQQDVPNIMQTVDLTVVKVDEYDRPIEGCVFELYPAENIVVRGKTLQSTTDKLGTVTTDANGVGKPVDADGKTPIIYSNFKYKLVEAECPDEYIKLTAPVYFTATSTEHTVAVIPHDTKIPNVEKKGAVEIQKHTEGDVNREGIRFTLTGTSATNRDISVEATTDADGKAVISDIPIGTYTVAEDGTTVGAAYITAGSQTVDVTYNETAALDFINKEKEGSVHVIKTTEGQKNVSGIEFVLSGTSATGRAIRQTATTDASGNATFAAVPIGTYTVSENDATVAEWYVKADDQQATVLYNETTDLTFFNKEKQGTLHVVKHTEGDYNVSGIQFILKGTSDSGRDIERKAATDTNGDVTFTEIPIGTYDIYEDGETVPTAYLIADKQSVTIENAKTTDATFFNKEKEGTLHVVKHTEGDYNVSGIQFILKGTSDSGRDIERKAATDTNGDVTFTEIPIGTYDIYEDGETVPTAYLVADPQEATVTYAKTTDASFFNTEKTGTLQIQKRTEGDKNIEGIKFILDGTSDSGRAVHQEKETDEKGQITFDAVPIGTYDIFEDGDTVPYGYLTADPQKGEVTYASTTELTFINDETKVNISKKAITGDNELPGAKLQVLDKDGNVVDEWISTEEVHHINGVLKAGGTYVLHEEIAPDGYVLANDVEFTVNSDGTVTKVEMKDDTTKVNISKKAITGDDELPGAKLQVLDKDGNTVEEWTSTTEPHFIEGKLKAGETYTLREITAPDGYIVANDIEFTVSEDGSVDTVEMKDDTTKVKISKKAITGDDELPGAKLQVLDKDGKVIDEWVSTEEAHYIEGKLKAGETYTLHEETAPDGYVIASDIEFKVSEDGSVDFVEMKDDTTKVTISKKAITGDDKLPGAKLQVLDKDGNVIEEWTSTEEAHFIEGRLKAGETYTLREITAPEGYEIANDVTFTVNEDGSVNVVVMYDEQTPNPHTSGAVAGTSALLLAAVTLLAVRKRDKE